MFVRGSAGIGRQARLRILCRIRRVGSSPIFRIKSLGFPDFFYAHADAEEICYYMTYRQCDE